MGKVALVTGAAAGIGRACCLRLARAGLSVGVLDINLEGCERVVAEIKAAGGNALALQASVTDRAKVTSAVAKLRETFGPVLILVNNAGIVDFEPFDEISDESWDRIYEVNVKGVFIVTQVVLPDMKAAQWGRIINISSSGAQTGAPTVAHYTSSKAAIFGLTRSLALEFGPLGITVNNVPPGSIMNTELAETNKQRFPISVETLRATLPVRRMGEPEDVANAVAWLASEDTGFVTGQTIGVNGGRVVS
jgi:2-hydroxycyclohexanecarboxyl-CoA dehydrogenase